MEKGDFCISTITPSNIPVLLTIGVITILVVRIMYVIYRSSKSLHSKSPHPSVILLFWVQEAVFKRFASLQATDGRSVTRAMAATKREVSLRWSSY